MSSNNTSTYAEEQMKLMEVSDQDIFHPFQYHPETHDQIEVERTWYKERFVSLTEEQIKSEFRNVRGVQPGDLLINYFDLNNVPYDFQRKGVKSKTRYRIIRLQDPVGDKKYHLPYGADTTRPYLPLGLILKYHKGAKIKTLIITEGAKKAFVASKKGVDIVGLTSITHYRNKKHDTIHPEILKIIDHCRVQRVVMLYDGDAMNISTTALKDKEDLKTRPFGFVRSMLSVRKLLSEQITDEKINLYFAYVRSSNIEGNPKGLDDLFQALPDEAKAIKKDLLQFDKLNESEFFFKVDVSYDTRSIAKALHVDSPENFYFFHRELIGERPFMYDGTIYEWNAGEGKMDVKRPGAASEYIRVGDDYFQMVQVPDKNEELSTILARRSKTTIRDDHGKYIFNHINKFNYFCNVPNHVNYQQVINNCWNAYYPFSHEPEEGDLTTTLNFLKHIFGHFYELALDYVQLLYQEPQQKLPILCLVSKEQKTGKSTFLNWLHHVFEMNMAVIGNADIQNDFNSFWATKLIVACEEAFLEKKLVVEKIKALSTGDKITVNAKGRDQYEVDFFAKFIFLSNNEDNMIPLHDTDTRYWIVKVPTVKDPVFNLEDALKQEIPAFLYFLQRRKMHVPVKEDRMWFSFDRIRTRAFETMVANNRSTVEKEIRTRLNDMFIEYGEEEIMMNTEDIRNEFFKGRRYESNYIKRVIQNDMNVERYAEYYAEKKWFKEFESIPANLRAEAKPMSKTIRYTYPKMLDKFDENGNPERVVGYTNNIGRPFVFKREMFVDEADLDIKPEGEWHDISEPNKIKQGDLPFPVEPKNQRKNSSDE